MGRRYGSSSNKFTSSEILESFLEVEPRKKIFGNFRIEDDQLVYRAQSSCDASRWSKGDDSDFAKAKKEIGAKIKEHDGRLVDEHGKSVMLESLTKNSPSHGMRIQYHETDLVAQKVKCENEILLLGNSSTLALVGRTVAYGRTRENRETTEIQSEMKRRNFIMIPFDEFGNLKTFKLIDKQSPEVFKVKQKNSGYHRTDTDVNLVNFGGAMLFSLSGKTYLSDVDRREIKYQFLNKFIVEVSGNCHSIGDAYKTLLPSKLNGVQDVKRQGQWFFKPCDAPTIPVLSVEQKMILLSANVDNYHFDKELVKALTGFTQRDLDQADSILKQVPREIELKIDGVNRALTVQTCIELDGVTYCRGEVSSDNRAKLTLNDWHIAVCGE